MKANKKFNWGIFFYLGLKALFIQLAIFYANKYGFWPVFLTTVGGILILIYLLNRWIKKPPKERKKKPRKEYKKEIHIELSREVAVPPEFFFSMFYDADFHRRLNENFIDIYIDREEVGGHIIYTSHTNKGIQTSYSKIIQWNPPRTINLEPLLFGTESTTSTESGEIKITIIHRRKFEKTAKGTRFTVHSQIIYISTNRINVFINALIGRKAFKNYWNRIIKEVENQFELRKHQKIAL